MAATLAGHHRIVVLEGEAGMGKTTLLEHWLEPSVDERPAGAATVLRASAEEAESSLAWGLLGQLLVGLAQLDGQGAGRLPAPDADPLSVGQGLVARLTALAEVKLVVLVLEDLHWSDEPSSQALRFALRHVGSAPVLTVASVRPPFPGALGEGWRRLVAASGRVVHLRGLDRQAVAELARAFGRTLPDRRAAQLQTQTDGNPLWVSALLRELSDQVLCSDAIELAVPHDLATTIQAQYGALPEPARALVAAGAVLGNRFDTTLAAGIAEITDPAAALEEAESAGILADTGAGQATFRHTLLRSAVLGGLGAVHRSTLHSAAARRLSGAAALEHLALATLAPSEPVAAELEQASRLELAASELTAATRHAEAAWRLSPPGPAHRRRALLAMETALAAGMPGAARLHVAEVAGPALGALAGGTPRDGPDPQSETPADGDSHTPPDSDSDTPPDAESGATPDREPDPERDHLLGWLARSEGRFVVAESLLRRAETALDARPEPDVATWRQRRGAVALERALLAVVRMATPEAQAMARQAGDLVGAGPSRHLAKAVQAISLALEGATAEALGVLDPGAPAIVDLHELGVRGVVRLWADDLRGAYEDLSATVRRLEEGEVLVVLQARAYLSETCFRMGRLDEARRLAETACDMVDEAGRWWDVVIVHTRAGCAAAVAGDLDAARSHIGAITALATRIGNVGRAQDAPAQSPETFQRLRNSLAASSGVAVALAIAADDPEALLAAAEPAAELVQGTDPGTFPYGPVLAEALVGLGRLDEATACLTAYEERAARLGRRLATMQALRIRGMLRSAHGDHPGAREAFERALAIGTALDAPLELARTRTAFGRALAASGEIARARRELAGAERLLATAGAHGWMPAVRTGFAALERQGGEGRAEHLTGSEVRIAELAAQGLSNPEIAVALSLSRKTVEYHLAHVFRKLQIRSRAELRPLFHGSD